MAREGISEMLCPNVETAAGTHLVLGATFAMRSAGCVELQKRTSEQETDPAPEANTPLTAIDHHKSAVTAVVSTQRDTRAC